MVVSLVLRAQKRCVDVYWKTKKRGFERYCPKCLLKPDTSVVRKAITCWVEFRLPKGDPAAERSVGGRLVLNDVPAPCCVFDLAGLHPSLRLLSS